VRLDEAKNVVSRLPKPGERARILPSEEMDRIGVAGRCGEVLDHPGVCIVVRLDDAGGIEWEKTNVGENGVVFCTISEVELAEGER
jgi:hypothetical protein